LAALAGRVVLAYPAGRLSVASDSEPVSLDTAYDLASLTKILSTTILAMIFIEKGWCTLDATLSETWPGLMPEDKKTITFRQLLNHSTGLPAWRPLYDTLEPLPVELRRARAAELILREPLECFPGEKSLYSDLNFILLGFMLEQIGRASLDVLFDSFIAQPLKLRHTGYRPLDKGGMSARSIIAPTEVFPEQREALQGEVHDRNARALGGTAGHAGLFGPAMEVWLIMKDLIAAFKNQPGPHLVSNATVRTFWQRHGSTRALGFDMPSETGSAAGELFSRASVGHLGFTGTSLWYDPSRDLTVILLTNRVHPSTANEAIREFRPVIHDLAVRAVQ